MCTVYEFLPHRVLVIQLPLTDDLCHTGQTCVTLTLRPGNLGCVHLGFQPSSCHRLSSLVLDCDLCLLSPWLDPWQVLKDDPLSILDVSILCFIT